ncbi:MAG: RCC1 domain-containing protein, partial [Polyangiaceae bacterium]|nr:RCC1 domain-containing protein [Polyangiaceae bacterium]
CALRDDGRLLCWGENASGQLGNNTNVGTGASNPAPTLVDNTNLGVVRQLTLGSEHICALREGACSAGVKTILASWATTPTSARRNPTPRRRWSTTPISASCANWRLAEDTPARCAMTGACSAGV